jgi:GNAT superfamily N-acetyltransferase
MSLPGVQFDGTGVAVAPDPGAVVLGPDDVPEMLDLVKRTRPGPFRQATIAMGTYLGFRAASGALVAMAGERMRPLGWTEISAVCTDPAHRGRGLATRLVRAVGADVIERNVHQRRPADDRDRDASAPTHRPQVSRPRLSWLRSRARDLNRRTSSCTPRW